MEKNALIYNIFVAKTFRMDSKLTTIEQINRLNATTFHLLYKNYYKALVNYVMQIVNDFEVAEDITQDLFSTLWERKIVFKSITSFKVYLYNSVRNSSLDYLKHKNVESDYLQKVADMYQPYQFWENSEEDLWNEEVYRQLFHTIDDLPQRCREVFLMYMDGKTNEEISTALNVSIETVKTQKKRGMVFLRKRLNKNTLLLLQIFLT